MTLATKLVTPPDPRRGPDCSMRTILRALPEQEAQAVQAALNNPDWTAAALARLLTQEGHRIQDTTVRRHRRGDCLCPYLDEKENTQ